MLVKVVTGTSPRGAFRYALGNGRRASIDQSLLSFVRAHPELEGADRATQLEALLPEVAASEEGPAYRLGSRARIIGGRARGRTTLALSREFERFRSFNPRVKNIVHHAILSAREEVRPSVEGWRRMTQEYLQRMGYERSLYVVIQHRDKGCDHVHIYASNVTIDGAVVDQWQNKRRAEAVVHDLCIEEGLEPLAPSREYARRSLTRGEQQRADATREPGIMRRLQESIDQVLVEGKDDGMTVPEFIDRLAARGVGVRPFLKRGKLEGLIYDLDGVYMTGSKLGNGFKCGGVLARGVSYDRERDLSALLAARMASLEVERDRRAARAARLAQHSYPPIEITDPGGTSVEICSRAGVQPSELAAHETPCRLSRRLVSDRTGSLIFAERRSRPELSAVASYSEQHFARRDELVTARAQLVSLDDELARVRVELSSAIVDLHTRPAAGERDAAAGTDEFFATLSDDDFDRVIDDLFDGQDTGEPPPTILVKGSRPAATSRFVERNSDVSQTAEVVPYQQAPAWAHEPSALTTAEAHPPAASPLNSEAIEPTSEFTPEAHAGHEVAGSTLADHTPQRAVEPSVTSKADQVAGDLPALPAGGVLGVENTSGVVIADADRMTVTFHAEEVMRDISASSSADEPPARIMEKPTPLALTGLAQQGATPLPIVEREPTTSREQEATTGAADEQPHPNRPVSVEASGSVFPHLVSAEKAKQVDAAENDSPTSESARSRGNSGRRRADEAIVTPTVPPAQERSVGAEQHVGVILADARHVESEPAVSASPRVVESDDAPRGIAPASIEQKPQPTQPAASPRTLIEAAKSLAASEPLAGGAAASEQESTGRSLFKPLRDLFDPAAKQRRILAKYRAEREAAVAGMKMPEGESDLRACALLDRAIVHAARGQQHAPTDRFDLPRVLSELHARGDLREGKNWMDADRGAAQDEDNIRVWGETGWKIRVAASRAAQADKDELCGRAYRAYEAKYACAPHHAVTELFGRELDRMERRAPSAEHVSLADRMNEQRAAAVSSPTPATEQEAWARVCRELPNGDAKALALFEQIERVAVKTTPAEKLAELKPLTPSDRGADAAITNYVMTHHPEIVEGARGWCKRTTGSDLTAEQRSVFIRTVWERTRVKPDAKELRAVRLLSLKRGVPPPRIGSSLEARVACAELAGTDRHETLGRLAVEIQKRHDEMDRRAARIDAQFTAALPQTPHTPEHLPPTTIKQVVELTLQREREITAKYARPIEFAEDQCRRAGDTPTAHSRKALVAMLAVQDATQPSTQTLGAYHYLHKAKNEDAAPPPDEATALTIVNNLKGTSNRFWLGTGRAAIKMGERVRQIEEMSGAATEVYRNEKGREPSEELRLALRQKLLALAGQPPPDEQTLRIARLAEHQSVPAPVFADAASSSCWLMRNSPDGDDRLLRFVKAIEAQVVESARVFQIDPIDPQQRAGVLCTEWMVATVRHAEYEKLPQRNIDEWGCRVDQESRTLDEYRRAARQHEELYGAQPRAVMTGEQHDHLLEHGSSLGSVQRQALADAIVAGVSPESEPLGRAPEPGHGVHAPSRSPSRSDDFSR